MFSVHMTSTMLATQPGSSGSSGLLAVAVGAIALVVGAVIGIIAVLIHEGFQALERIAARRHRVAPARCRVFGGCGPPLTTCTCRSRRC